MADPPLKLILIEGHGQPASLNHLGVEVASTDDVSATQARLAGEGMVTATEDNVTCCYAVQDKVWVDDPDGAPWEIYTVLADAETAVAMHEQEDDGGRCGAGACATTTPQVASSDTCCA